jgi:hypothetical protein
MGFTLVVLLIFHGFAFINPSSEAKKAYPARNPHWFIAVSGMVSRTIGNSCREPIHSAGRRTRKSASIFKLRIIFVKSQPSNPKQSGIFRERVYSRN